MKINNFLTGTISFISIAVAVNIFYSFIWHYKYLSQYQLSTLSIISIDDLLFKFGTNTILIFSLTFIWSIAWHIKYLKNSDNFNFNFQKMKEAFYEKLALRIIILILLILLLVCIFQISLIVIEAGFSIQVLFAFLILLIAYGIWRDSWEELFILQVLLAFFWGTIFITDIFENFNKKSESKNFNIKEKERIIFDFDGKTYGTKSNEFLVFHGYKSIVLGEIITDSNKRVNNIYHIFQTDKISKLTFTPSERDEK
jgi:hypothetical protein